MAVRAIHQFVAGFNRGDAISNEALLLRKIVRGWGMPSDIWCEARRVPPDLRSEVRDPSGAGALGPDDGVILHLSIGSDINDLFTRLPCRRAVLYHNMTPADYFRGVREQTAHVLERGRAQIPAVLAATELAMAVSGYNAAELAAAGAREVRVFPLALDFSFVRSTPDRGWMRELGDGLVNVLFVGRGVPNKRIEDLLAVFHYFQRTVEPESRLVHVGSYAGTENYLGLLQARAREWRLKNVVFAGAVPQARMVAAYRTARLFVCMSEHEGFCAPLLEAMAHDVPVLAHASAAVPETLGGAGVLVAEKRFDAIAEMAGRLVRDETLRGAVLARQRRRLAEFEARDVGAELRGHLAGWLA